MTINGYETINSKILLLWTSFTVSKGCLQKKNFIWKEKFLSGGGGGKKKGPNFPSKRAKKVGN